MAYWAVKRFCTFVRLPEPAMRHDVLFPLPRISGGTLMHVQQMIASHPQLRTSADDALARCVEACYDCAQSCTACMDACLGEEDVKPLIQCIRLNLDCADVCAAAGAVISRRTGNNREVTMAMLDACALACNVCGQECDMHGVEHEHCRVCAEVCHRCEEACAEALQLLERMQ